LNLALPLTRNLFFPALGRSRQRQHD
jgi:hypothetical protein